MFLCSRMQHAEVTATAQNIVPAQGQLRLMLLCVLTCVHCVRCDAVISLAGRTDVKEVLLQPFTKVYFHTIRLN